jgi:hypothetical protein
MSRFGSGSAWLTLKDGKPAVAKLIIYPILGIIGQRANVVEPDGTGGGPLVGSSSSSSGAALVVCMRGQVRKPAHVAMVEGKNPRRRGCTNIPKKFVKGGRSRVGGCFFAVRGL